MMKIVVAADHRLMRDGLRAILQAEGLVVVGDADSVDDAMHAAARERPDLILIEACLLEIDGTKAVRRLKMQCKDVLVAGIPTQSDTREVAAILATDARGFLSVASTADELLLAVRIVASGRRYLSQGISPTPRGGRGQRRSGTGDKLDTGSTSRLTLREREVLQLLAEGRSSKDIARQLRVALATVETHRRQISDKLGLRGVARLTKWAIREGLTSID